MKMKEKLRIDNTGAGRFSVIDVLLSNYKA